ncbi:S8 family serine peptidase [Roseomonas sp. NAR14]|uniref:S8 family serine peptidase n=1 Tax=Roseomonas acroporae TaxID=2937791 RepID=A0A9X1Y4H7_9PROT|nr:S8 family serine peptidase [Roseomonas acroporae]MCK8784069.1 S8 family serine peptidase [Roseomonas acroporae]
MLAAMAMIFRDAPAPCVALMANSDNLGPHDGSLLGERFLNELLLHPGRAVVLTMGNLNHDVDPTGKLPAYHAFDPGPAEREARFTLEFGDWKHADAAEVWFRPAPGGAMPRVEARIADETRQFAIAGPGGKPQAEAQVLIGPQDMRRLPGLAVTALLQTVQDRTCLRLVFKPPTEGASARCTWTIVVPAVGPVHGWLDRNNSGSVRWAEGAEAGANRTTLGSPAVAARVLSVGAVTGTGGAVVPWPRSGRGPTRDGLHPKPELVACGTDRRGAIACPWPRLKRLPEGEAPDTDYGPLDSEGTSYAAPQVAGACARLFERFGPEARWASWADLRQILVERARRDPSMPPPETGGWDPACGYGRLDVAALAEAGRRAVDPWIRKAAADDGTEPFVARAFWDSPALVPLDAGDRALDAAAVALGAPVARLRVGIGNRGTRPATDLVVSLHWAPLGTLYPLPAADGAAPAWMPSGPWSTEGLGAPQALASVPPDPEDATEATAAVTFDYVPPRNADGTVRAHMLLARVTGGDAPAGAAEPLCARNNAAALAVAAALPEAVPPAFEIRGSDDTDGVALWLEGCGGRARLCLEGLPVSALPWRRTGMYRPMAPARPRHGDGGIDPATLPEEDTVLVGAADIAARTDVEQALRLELRGGLVCLEGGTELFLPRLRLVPGEALALRVRVLDRDARKGGGIGLLHLSGGRRVGGGMIRLLPAPDGSRSGGTA